MKENLIHKDILFGTSYSMNKFVSVETDLDERTNVVEKSLSLQFFRKTIHHYMRLNKETRFMFFYEDVSHFIEIDKAIKRFGAEAAPVYRFKRFENLIPSFVEGVCKFQLVDYQNKIDWLNLVIYSNKDIIPHDQLQRFSLPYVSLRVRG